MTFTPEQFPQLNLDHPRLWWPAQMGKPERYSLSLEFELDGKISDQPDTKFGIREVKSEVLSANRRLFSINGKNILIRGGGWSPDMMLRQDPQRLRDEFRYVQDMGLNTIRLEGKLETKEFLRPGRRARNSAHRRLVLLRPLGALAELEGRRTSPSPNVLASTRCTACAAIPA